METAAFAYRVSVVGGLCIDGGRRPVTRPDWPTLPQQMTYLLALSERPLPSVALRAMLWPGMADRWSATRLPAVAAHLRSTHPGLAEYTRDGWQLGGGVTCDLLEMRAARAAGDAQALADVFDSWPELHDGDLPAPRYDSAATLWGRATAELMAARRVVAGVQRAAREPARDLWPALQSKAKIRLLGGLEVRDVTGDAFVPERSNDRRVALLGTIALGEGAPVPCRDLSDAVWGGDASAPLRKGVERLRKRFAHANGEAVINTRGAYALDTRTFMVDTVELVEAVRVSRAGDTATGARMTGRIIGDPARLHDSYLPGEAGRALTERIAERLAALSETLGRRPEARLARDAREVLLGR